MKTRILSASIALITTQFTTAAPITWDGDTSTVFSLGGNWVSGAAPGAADVATFSNAAVTFQPTITATGSLGGLDVQTATAFTLNTFNNTMTVSGAFIGGGAVTVAGYAPGSTNQGVLVFTNTANTFSGGLTITGGNVRYNSGALANTSFGTQAITLDGGTFTYQGPEIAVNTQTGAPSTAADRSFLNALTIGVNGGRLDLNQGSGTANLAVIYPDVALGGALTFGSAGGGNSFGITFGGSVTLNQASAGVRRLTGATDHNGSDYVSGNIVDGMGAAGNALRISSQNRTLIVSSGANTYSGGTIAEPAGTSAGSVVRFLAQSLAGTGSLTVESGGRIHFNNLQPTGVSGGLSGSATITAADGGAVGAGRFSIAVVGDRTATSDVLTNVVSTRDLVVGEPISGTGIQAGSTIVAILSDTSVQISQPALTTGASTSFTAAGLNVNATSRFTAASSGIYAIEGTHSYNIDQATVGNGRVFLGQGVAGGTFSGSLSPGAGATYRIGGGLPTAGASSPTGFGSLTISGAGALSGASNLVIGPNANARTNLARVIVTAGQSFAGNGSGSAVVVNAGSELYTALDGGAPFGAAANAIEIRGVIGAAGTAGSFIGLTHPLTFLPGSGLTLSQSGFTNGDAAYAGVSGQGRWGNSTSVALSGATLTLDRGRNAVSLANEDIGPLTFAGRSAVAMVNITAGGQRYDLQADSLARIGRGVLNITKVGVLGGTGVNDSQFRVDGLAANTNGMLTLGGAAAPFVVDATSNTFVRNGTNGIEDVVYDFTGATALTNAGVDATKLVDQSGAITLTGPVTLFAMRMSNNAITGTATNNVTIASGGAIFSGSTHTARMIFESSPGTPVEAIIRANGATSLSGSVIAQAGLTKIGGSSLSLSGTANDIVGGIVVWEGTLQPTSTSNSADFSDNLLTVGHAGTFNLNARSVTLAGLSGEGTTGSVQNNAGASDVTLTLDFASGTQTYEGALSENATNPSGLALLKAGSGTQILAGIGSYTGGTTVTSGALIIQGSLTGSGPVAATGGTLGGSGLIAGNITIGIGATLAPGGVGADTTGTLSAGASLALSDTSIAAFGIGGTAAGAFDRITGITALTLDGAFVVAAADGFATTGLTAGATFDLLDWSGPLTNAGFAFDFSGAPLGAGLSWDTTNFATDGSIAVVIPEPGSAALLLAGLALLARRRR